MRLYDLRKIAASEIGRIYFDSGNEDIGSKTSSQLDPLGILIWKPWRAKYLLLDFLLFSDFRTLWKWQRWNLWILWIRLDGLFNPANGVNNNCSSKCLGNCHQDCAFNVRFYWRSVCVERNEIDWRFIATLSQKIYGYYRVQYNLQYYLVLAISISIEWQ